MDKPQKTYSAYQLISVAEVANTLAQCRSIAGLEALHQLAEAVERGFLCADLYPPHDRCFNGGNSELIGNPTSNSPGIWRNLAKKAVERYKGDVDDFSYPPAASTWHLLADDVFAFANNSEMNTRAVAAMRELAIRYKAELGDAQGDAAEPRAPAQSTAPPAPGVAASDGPASIIHSTKARRNTLTPVIELAQSKCRNSTDPAEVWAVLLALAEKQAPPLIGATEDGLQYLKSGTAEIFKRKSLGKRLTR